MNINGLADDVIILCYVLVYRLNSWRHSGSLWRRVFDVFVDCRLQR